MSEAELAVLYVDDEPGLLEITQKFLSKLGLQVEVSESGAMALEIMSQNRYDAIISDYQMPQMNGIQLLKEIRSRYPRIPFILFTGRGREEVVIEAIENGADFYLQKGGSPVPQFTELAHKIRLAVKLRRDEQALRESEERFNQVASDAGEWIWETGTDGLYRYCSATVTKILGYHPEELVGVRFFFDLFDPRSREEQKQQILRVMRKQPSVQGIIGHYHHKDGKEVILQSSYSQITDPSGTLTGYRGLHLDVTRQKKDEELIRLHEKRLVRAQEIGKTGSWEYNINTGLLWGSEMALRLFGYHRPSGSITVEEIEQCIVERDIVHECLVNLVTHGAEYNIEYTVTPADGAAQRIIASIASLEPDEQGSGQKVIGVVQDITERRQAEQEIRRMKDDIAAAYEELLASEEELRSNYQELATSEKILSRSEALMRGLFDTMPSGAAIYRVINDGEKGKDYIVVDFNKAALDLESKSREDVIGRSLTELRPAIDEYGLIPIFQQVWKTGEPAAYPAKVYSDDKYENWYENFVFRIPTGEIVAIYNDVTEKMRAAEELVRSEKHYRILAENLKDVVWILDTETVRYKYVSPSVLQLRGYTAEEVMNAPFDEAFSPETTHNLFTMHATRMQDYLSGAGEQFYTDRIEQRCRDGSTVWTEVISEYYTNEETGTIELRGVTRDISERIQAERALEASKQRYLNLMEVLPISLSIVHNNTEVTYCNERFTLTTGYTNEDIPTLQDWWNKAYPDPVYRSQVVREWEELVHSAEYQGIDIRPAEYQVTRKDGVVRVLEISGVHLGDDYLVTQIDVTARKRAEEALIESETKFRSLVENSLEGIIILDLQGTILFANHAAYQLVEAEESAHLIGTPVIQFIDPRSHQDVIHDFSEVARGHDRYLAQYHAITRTGRHIQVQSIGKRIIFEGMPAILLSTDDITIRKEAEAALFESQRKYQELIEIGNESIFLIENESGAILEANSAASEMYGYTHDELLSMQIEELYASEEENRNIPIKTQEGSVIIPLQYHLKKNREIFPVEIAGRVFTWKDRPVHVAAIRDISDRIRGEDALRQANRQLSLLSDITRHDILNHLHAIFGYLEIALDEITDPALEDYIRKVESSARTIQAAIEFTRIYQHLGTIDPQWISVKTVLPYEQVPDGMSLTADLDDLWIYVDPMLEKVFSNLLDNSIRHGKHVTEVRISCKRDGERMIITYEDNGAGIPSDEKERIFERGYGKNTGLGLFLVRDILSITGIQVTETGLPGSGARFLIIVPKGAYRIGE